ncbi:hypothetical protein [Adonisia turfae]|uniref:hypothetical protein n=1 Tax=Adonisia turfae TaxID=2950184 RepID=UPI0013CF5093|nr:hypothetical protein [Adonisia turfae]
MAQFSVPSQSISIESEQRVLPEFSDLLLELEIDPEQVKMYDLAVGGAITELS